MVVVVEDYRQAVGVCVCVFVCRSASFPKQIAVVDVVVWTNAVEISSERLSEIPTAIPVVVL